MEKYIIKFRGKNEYSFNQKLEVGYYTSRRYYHSIQTSDPGYANIYRKKSIAKRTVNRLTKEVKNNRWRGIELKQYSDGSYFIIVKQESFLQIVYSIHVGCIYPDTEFDMDDVRGLVFVQETKRSKQWLKDRDGYYVNKKDAERKAKELRKKVLKYLVDFTVAFEKGYAPPK